MSSDCPSSGSTPRTLIAVCTLNEAGNIGTLIDGLTTYLPTADILILDDDSSDGTGDQVKLMQSHNPSIHLIVRTSERGLGTAIRAAMVWAVERDYEYLLNLDGDLSHDPEQLPRLWQQAREKSVDVVIGSRYVAGGAVDGWPLHRRLMSRMVNAFARVCLRLPVSDCSGSMRCYRVSALRTMDPHCLTSQGYSVLEEILVRLKRTGASMSEVPITFTDRIKGESKLTMREAIRSIFKMMALAIKT